MVTCVTKSTESDIHSNMWQRILNAFLRWHKRIEVAQRLEQSCKCELRLNGRATEDLSDRFSLVQTESTAYPSLLPTERTNNFGNGGQFFFVNRDKCFMPLSGLMIKLSNAILNIRMHRCRALSSTLLKHNVIITIDYIDQISKLLPVISFSTKKLSSQIKLRCTNYESKWLLWNNLLPVRTVNRKRRKEMFSTYER